MKCTITSGMIAAGLLVTLGGSRVLSAQSTTRPAEVMAQDTACMIDARPLGDTLRTGEPKVWTDSAGLNKPTARRNCAPPNMAAQDNSGCWTMNPDSTTYLQGDRAASATKKVDSLASRARAGQMSSNCPRPLGAGVGTDSTTWPARPDNKVPRKP